nr:hypothetical protein [uncultured Acidovorax sp.]
MSKTNLFRRLQELLPDEPQLSGQITGSLGSGRVRIELPGGGALEALNPSGLAVGTWVYVKGGAIIGEAPDLPYVLIEI